MQITNNYGLPSFFEKLIEKNDYKYQERRYSVTELLKPVREILLTRRHYDEIDQDLSDMTPLIFGTAIHELFEKLADNKHAEEKIEYTLNNGVTISGIIDFFDEDNYIIIDYKTTSANKIMKQDFQDWKLQGLMYALLKLKNNVFVDKIRFYAFIKDWSKMRSINDPNYPQTPIYIYEYQVSSNDLIEIERYIINIIDLLLENECKSDNELLPCSQNEKWYTGTKYAVYKKNSIKAYRVFDSEEEAQELMKTIKDSRIEIRKGENFKCKHFCLCSKFCNKKEE